MTNTPHAIVERPGERGSALVMVLLLLMLMSALVAALSMSGQTETFIARNQNAAAQAQAAAEAGLNHAVEIAVTYIFEFNANGFATADQAVAALLVGPDNATGSVGADADNGSLGQRPPAILPGEAIEPGVPVEIEGTTLTYTAVLMDDTPTAPPLMTEMFGGVFEPYVDRNKRLVIRATGFGPDNTAVTLEAVIGPAELPGVVVNGDLEINGGVEIVGSSAGVHSNGDLEKSGASGELLGTLSTSGTYIESGSGSLTVQEGVREKTIPEVRASDYRSRADYILTSAIVAGDLAGTIANQSGVVLAVCNKKGCAPIVGAPAALANWNMDVATGDWSFNSSAPPTGTYYVEGDVSTTGAPTAQITLITEGSIDIGGGATFTPDTPELLFVTDMDLKIRGLDAAVDINVQGQMLVHGQVDIFGNVDLAGQLVVENTAGAGTLVADDQNFIGGSVTITYNGGLGGHMYGIDGWRDVRDVD